MKVLTFFIIAAGLMSVLSGCIESDQDKFNRAMEFYTEDASDKKAISEANKLLEELSLKEHAKAQYMLARMYIRGDGVVIDFNRALQLLLKSSSNGNGDASLYASRFYSEDKFNQELDESMARQLLFKSARDGSDIGKIMLGGRYLFGGMGISKDKDEAVKELESVSNTGPYRAYAAAGLLNIYAEKGQKYYAPEKAVRALEELSTTGNSMFKGLLAAAYSGEILGAKETRIKNREKLESYLRALELQNDMQALAVAKIMSASDDENKVNTVQIMLDTIQSDNLDPFFANMFCDQMAGFYVGIEREEKFKLTDIIKACAVGAEKNNSYHQYLLAASYYRAEDYTSAYKWAFVSGMNDNESGMKLAREIALNHISAKLADLNKEASSLRESLRVVSGTSLLPPHPMPWYKPQEI